MEVTIEMRGNRLFVAKKLATGEAKLARFKARLAERIRERKCDDMAMRQFMDEALADVDGWTE